MLSIKLSPDESKILRDFTRKNKERREIVEAAQPPTPFDAVFRKARSLPYYEIVFGAWARAMEACEPGDKSKFIRVPSGHSYVRRIWKADGTCTVTTHRHFKHYEGNHFLYLYGLDGDAGLGNGDAEAGRQLRLAIMEAAREAGDFKFVKAIENLRDRWKQKRNLRPTEDADKDVLETRKLILGAWLPFSLWAMDDAAALSVICSIRKGSSAGPDLKAWRQQRYQMRLATWRQIGSKCPLLEFFDETLRHAQKSKAGKYSLREDCDP
jgi:hypothetical protein